MIGDCHLHTAFSFDSEADIQAQTEQAVRLGMKHICFTDHMDMDYPGGEFFLDTPAYVQRVLEMREKYRDEITVCLGVEVGLQEHLKERLTQYLDQFPFDFVIGSMHVIHGEDPYYGEIFQRLGDEEAYREYFRSTADNLKQAPKIQTLGHLDYIVRYGKERERFYSYEKFSDEIDRILRLLIEKEIALEVNTGGTHALPFPNPHPDVICRYRQLGGEMITIGSDAHAPEHMGRGFDKLPELLKSCGFQYYTVFREKKPKFMKI